MSIKIALLVFLIGIFFLIIELFIPGFGIFGITGLGLIVYSAYSLLQYSFGFFMIVGLVIFASFVTYMAWKFIKRNGLDKGLVLDDTIKNTKKDIGGLDYLVGKIGMAKTPLRPVGNADFNGITLEVHSEGEYITENTKIKVTSISGNKIIVTKYKEINAN